MGMYKSHAELEAEHYKAIRENPMYRLEGMMSVLREELSMSMPYYLKEDPKEIKPVFRHRPIDNEVDQLKAGFVYLNRKLNEIQDKKRVDKQGTKYTLK